ncbi:transaldolase [Gloeobacter kilaueensis]|uniref:Transaldolase n=1 Tax=Gloeobacter kilaueensis (strain ATCC BAA-2537 / CCAP 1431/1 / ULC 316 / JS1) TaxID=1183438 RepID=U5QG38_GLOK1|nr:transaldolase [Gloeobacter kilaueensis]AGY56609.1 transaldolase [Gloeobacter kilaueensis JS1]
MADNPLVQLHDYGQSVWVDDLRRDMITTGELKHLIESEGVRGLTSNPAIFEKAIVGSALYDAQIRANQTRPVNDIYEELVIKDIQDAADLFRPLYESSGGADGYVSLEVSPYLARDTEGTIKEAEHLWQRVDRPNLMIKVPGTKEGIPAFEHLIRSGINVNVTLLFSRHAYAQVVDAYLRGLEAHEGPLGRIASVASFFLSRIDTAVDDLLTAKIEQTDDPAVQERLKALEGTIAIANAKLAYAHFKNVFEGERFAGLAARGAKVQRLLWASTGTKNPQYRDVRYVEELVGPATVNTMPPATLKACADHCELRPSLESGVEQAEGTLAELQAVGIDLDQVTDDLLTDGLAKFTGPYDKLLASLRAKTEAVTAS